MKRVNMFKNFFCGLALSMICFNAAAAVFQNKPQLHVNQYTIECWKMLEITLESSKHYIHPLYIHHIQ